MMMSKTDTLFCSFLPLLLLLSPPRAAAHGGVVNVTRLLLREGNFGTFASLLAASGLENELEARQRHRGAGASAGITVFAPSDISFGQDFDNQKAVAWLLHAASPGDRLAVLRAHVASDRLSLPELRTAAPRPAQPTLATAHDSAGAGGGIARFTLNVTGSGEEDGPVTVSSGAVESEVDYALLDDGGRRAVAVIAVLDVLFPKEFVSQY